MEAGWQAERAPRSAVLPGLGALKTQDMVIPNLKLKLMGQIREVSRVKQ